MHSTIITYFCILTVEDHQELSRSKLDVTRTQVHSSSFKFIFKFIFKFSQHTEQARVWSPLSAMFCSRMLTMAA